MSASYPIGEIRALFPALCRIHNGRPAVYLDGPGGSQVVAPAITAMTNYMRRGVANTHGKFPSSEETERLIVSAREAAADLLACAPDEIAFGANATSDMFAVSRALSRSWGPDDEIVVSEMDHHSHIDTWLLAARDRGARVRFLKVDPETLTLDLAELDGVINGKTRPAAVGYASNALGAINDVGRIARRCREVGALLSVDAEHVAPHKPIDMRALGADFLFCPAYKFFGGISASPPCASPSSTHLMPTACTRPLRRPPASWKPERKAMRPSLPLFPPRTSSRNSGRARAAGSVSFRGWAASSATRTPLPNGRGRALRPSAA